MSQAVDELIRDLGGWDNFTPAACEVVALEYNWMMLAEQSLNPADIQTMKNCEKMVRGSYESDCQFIRLEEYQKDEANWARKEWEQKKDIHDSLKHKMQLAKKDMFQHIKIDISTIKNGYDEQVKFKIEDRIEKYSAAEAEFRSISVVYLKAKADLDDIWKELKSLNARHRQYLRDEKSKIIQVPLARLFAELFMKSRKKFGMVPAHPTNPRSRGTREEEVTDFIYMEDENGLMHQAQLKPEVSKGIDYGRASPNKVSITEWDPSNPTGWTTREDPSVVD